MPLVKALLDSHAFLWFVNDAPRLSGSAREAIVASDNIIYLSVVSAWELAVKFSNGKLTLARPFPDFLDEQLALNVFQILPIDLFHLRVLVNLPFHHKDPFDRLLAAQSLADGLILISADATLDAYGVNRLW